MKFETPIARTLPSARSFSRSAGSASTQEMLEAGTPIDFAM